MTRALVNDSPFGRLAIYEALQRHAGRGDWQAFLVGSLEYIESAGFDTSKLFHICAPEGPGGHVQDTA
jgi:hypothetical protein